jgi:ribosomal protein L31
MCAHYHFLGVCYRKNLFEFILNYFAFLSLAKKEMESQRKKLAVEHACHPSYTGGGTGRKTIVSGRHQLKTQNPT